ncbi:MAG: hypothetical protein R3F65_19500 [bacterium]|nr:hypothetical protein [Myxococcales bacterium]MCB9553685.1 hypothetical protein [Myxococcales bacterium]
MTRPALALLLLAAPAAAAEPDPPFDFGPVPGYTTLIGLQAGGSVSDLDHFGSDAGAYLGLEASYNRLLEGTWIGASADASWTFGRDEFLATLGPQLGHLALGLDAGPALRLRDGDPALGAAGRLVIGLGVFAVHVRYARFFAGDPHLMQFGITLKWPVWASDTEDAP